MLLLEAVAEVAHDEFDVITHATTAPLASVVVVKVAELEPAAAPLTLHAYEGALPPLVGVAVNVTDAPAQLGFVPAV
jgi:hypothetical protein